MQAGQVNGGRRLKVTDIVVGHYKKAIYGPGGRYIAFLLLFFNFTMFNCVFQKNSNQFIAAAPGFDRN